MGQVITFEQLFADDLQRISGALAEEINVLRGKSIFLSGGTGFLGRWLLEAIRWANLHNAADISLTVLSRDPKAFLSRMPHLEQCQEFSWLEGDVRSFDFPEKSFDHIIHAATDVNTRLNREEPLFMFDTIINGTRHMLDFAVECGARSFLLTSSGAVYGTQPVTLSAFSEDYCGAPDPLSPDAAYGEGKRMAEALCAIYSREFEISCLIARCFAFIGPFMPLDGRFAAGNFIRDAVNDEPVLVNGDGTPLRSFLYAGDLVIWLFKILVHGRSAYPYNVGSDEVVSIRDLAGRVAALAGNNAAVNIAKKAQVNALPQRYLPDISRARHELGLAPMVTLDEAILKTIKWARNES